MKIAKALKQKNVIVGELSTLKAKLLAQNVRQEGQDFDYDNKKVLDEAVAKINELIDVKSRIAVANSSVYADIFRMAELKSFIAHLKCVPVKTGVEKTQGYNGIVVETTYRSAISQVELDSIIAELESGVQALQDKLDTFNFTTEV